MKLEQDGLPERIGKTINELDIDFSRFTLVGWLLVLITTGLGVAVGWMIYEAMPQRGAMDRAPAVVPPLVGFFVCVGTFLLFRYLLNRVGLRITKPPHRPG